MIWRQIRSTLRLPFVLVGVLLWNSFTRFSFLFSIFASVQVSLMLSLNKTQKVRCSALEDQLVESLVDAMKQTAAADSNHSPDNNKGACLSSVAHYLPLLIPLRTQPKTHPQLVLSWLILFKHAYPFCRGWAPQSAGVATSRISVDSFRAVPIHFVPSHGRRAL